MRDEPPREEHRTRASTPCPSPRLFDRREPHRMKRVEQRGDDPRRGNAGPRDDQRIHGNERGDGLEDQRGIIRDDRVAADEPDRNAEDRHRDQRYAEHHRLLHRRAMLGVEEPKRVVEQRVGIAADDPGAQRRIGLPNASRFATSGGSFDFATTRFAPCRHSGPNVNRDAEGKHERRHHEPEAPASGGLGGHYTFSAHAISAEASEPRREIEPADHRDELRYMRIVAGLTRVSRRTLFA